MLKPNENPTACRGSIKIVVISDTHTYHDRITLPEGDMLIHAGDFSFTGNPYELESFNNWFDKQDFKYKIAIYGNHELTLDPKKNVYYKECRELLTSGIWLKESSVEIEGIKIWGSPATPEFMNWAFNYERGEDIKKIWDQIPECDILITHGPPFGILDQSSRNGEHLGDRDLLNAIQRVKPQLSIHGHIHGGYGRVDEYISGHKTTFLNASICNEAYQPINSPFVIHFNKE